jgi:hypothetical protein
MQKKDLEKIISLDAEAFGQDRRFFLNRRLERFSRYCKVLERNGGIQGFIMGYDGHGLVCAGPWIVRPGLHDPLSLVGAVSREAGDRNIRLGILENNPRALDSILSTGSFSEQKHSWRMVMGRETVLGNSPLQFAIGSPAKG